MDKYANRVRVHFEDEARVFDAHYDAAPVGLIDRVVDRAFRTERLARRVELVLEASQGADSVLEVGSGSGRVAVAIAQANPDAKITGVDFSREMNVLARARAARAGVADRCEFIDGDFLSQGFAAGSFDVVVAAGVFDYIHRSGPALRRLCDLAARRVGASFPARYRALTPVRWARLRAQGCPVRFFDRGELEAMAGATGARLERLDPMGSWLTGWYWLLLNVT